jgi:hypothetical protein
MQLGRSPADATQLLFDQVRYHFTAAYWSNLQFVMAHLQLPRPRSEDDSTSKQLIACQPALSVAECQLPENHAIFLHCTKNGKE